MALYLRILGRDPINPKIQVHQFESIVYLWAINLMTVQQARDAILVLSGAPLTAAEETEVQTLVATVPTGTTSAQQAARALALHKIATVLQLADADIAPFNTEAGIKTALGV